jgi:hypothetical protein
MEKLVENLKSGKGIAALVMERRQGGNCGGSKYGKLLFGAGKYGSVLRQIVLNGMSGEDLKKGVSFEGLKATVCFDVVSRGRGILSEIREGKFEGALEGKRVKIRWKVGEETGDWVVL